MKMFKTILAAALVFSLSLTSAMAKDETKTVSKSVAAFKAIAAMPKKGVPPALFKNVQAIAIFPGLSKLDFMVSGRAGSGRLLVRDGEGNWSSPVFVSIDGGTLGWQIVGEPIDLLLLLKDRKAVDAVMKEKFTLSGKYMAIPGPLGTTLKGATEEELKATINSYIFFRGTAEDFTVATSAVQVAGAANDAFYGGKKLRAEDIVAGKVGKPSAEIASLQKLLADFAAKK
jgi:lipid-binding SYLF domain-containing protein